LIVEVDYLGRFPKKLLRWMMRKTQNCLYWCRDRWTRERRCDESWRR
jgi:hypothetical protein